MDRIEKMLADQINGKSAQAYTGMVRQNGSPQTSGTMAQLFFAPMHTDP